jgi:chromosome segregation ATPase
MNNNNKKNVAQEAKDVLNGLQQIKQSVGEETKNVQQMTSQISQVQSTIHKSVDTLMESFSKESSYRRQMLNSFKTVTDLLTKCQQEKKTLPEDFQKQLEECESKIRQNEEKYEKSQQELKQQIDTLQKQLQETKNLAQSLQDQLTKAQSEIQKLKQEQQQLTVENTELAGIHRGYQDEIKLQISLFETLTGSLNDLKEGIDNLTTSTSQDSKDMAAYLPDTLLAEIRNDVLRGNEFKTLRHTNNIQGIVQKINEKWIVQIQNMKNDVNQIISNLNQIQQGQGQQNTSLAESLQTWTTYQTKLQDFLNTWQSRANNLVNQWLKM